MLADVYCDEVRCEGCDGHRGVPLAPIRVVTPTSSERDITEDGLFFGDSLTRSRLTKCAS